MVRFFMILLKVKLFKKKGNPVSSNNCYGINTTRKINYTQKKKLFYVDETTGCNLVPIIRPYRLVQIVI